MILNKKEWATVDEITILLLKYAPVMSDKDKQKIDNFIYLTAEATKKQKEARVKTAQTIAEKRKINPDYARPACEHRKNKRIYKGA